MKDKILEVVFPETILEMMKNELTEKHIEDTKNMKAGEIELKTSPCKGCIFREPECHGSCKQYKLWSKSVRKENDLKRTEHWKNAPSPWKRESSIEHRARTGRTGRRER